MSADVELMPLPEPSLIQSEAEFVYGYDREDMEAYASACVAHATAAKYAEREALRAEVRRLQALTRWQPIETAPRDGSGFLGYVRKDWIEGFYWTGAEWAYLSDSDLIPTGRKQPTNWMPLPVSA